MFFADNSLFKNLKVTLKLIDDRAIFEGIAFFQEKIQAKQVRVAYKLNVNSFRGNESLQLMIESIKENVVSKTLQ